jgi:hypothetical protein
MKAAQRPAITDAWGTFQVVNASRPSTCGGCGAVVPLGWRMLGRRATRRSPFPPRDGIWEAGRPVASETRPPGRAARDAQLTSAL